jgi:hypothetical protein
MKMGLAKDEIERANRGEGCLGKAAPSEPVFILRAQDALAADLVEKWAIWAQAAGCGNDKVREARDLAEEMRRWPVRKNPD